MDKKLNNILEEMVRYFFRDKIKDIRYYELFSKVNRLSHNLPIMRSVYATDLELASIMTYIEQQFHVPMLEINVKDWMSKDSDNEFILSIYNELSELRSL